LLLLPGLELPSTVFDRMCNNALESADRKGRSPPAKRALQPKSACEVLTTAELRLLQQSAVRILPAHITALCASPQLDCDLLQMLLQLPDSKGAAQSPTSTPLSSFRSLLSNPRLDAATLRLLLDALPPEVAGSDQWAAMGGDDATAQYHTSALALLCQRVSNISRCSSRWSDSPTRRRGDAPFSCWTSSD